MRKCILALLLLLSASALKAGSITGRLLDNAGKPVSGSKVQWLPYRTGEEVLLDRTAGQEPALLGETKTDAEGRFKVSFEKSGELVSLRILSPGLPSVGLSGPFETGEETPLFDIQLFSFEKISGRVRDEAAKPVAGARVIVAPQSLFGEESSSYAEAKTDAEGWFVIAEAPEAPRSLTIRAPGYVPAYRTQLESKKQEEITLKQGATIRGTVLEATGKPAPDAVVVVESVASKTDASGAYRLTGVNPGTRSVEALWKEDFIGRKEGVRVLKGGEAEVNLRLSRAASIAGTVIEEKTRKPAAGVAVSASASLFRLGGGGRQRRGRTDSRGRFRIGGLASGSYTIEASKEDFLPSSVRGIAVSVGSPGKVSLALSRAASVSGRVTDDKEEPVGGARMRLAQDPGIRGMLQNIMPGSRRTARGVLTAPDGSFRLRNLAPVRNASIEAVKTGFATARLHGLTLKGGEEVKNLALVLRKGLEARGRVIQRDEKPIAGAEVRVARRDREGLGGMTFRFLGEGREKPDATTGSDAVFVVRGLELGEYMAQVSREGYAPKSVGYLEVKEEGPNEWPDIVLSPGVAVAGVVQSAQGLPVSGAQILCFGEEGRPGNAVSDPEGRFRIDGLAAERPLRLSVSAEGYAAAQRSVTPPAEDLVVVLKTAGTIRGQVEDAATKRPIADFTVGRTIPSGGPGVVIMTGSMGDRAFHSEDGSFEFPGVEPGKWTLRASAAGYRSADVAGIELEEGETKEGILFSLHRGGSLSGRVLDPRRGTGVPNASVSWQPAGPESPRGMAAAMMARFGTSGNSTTTDADGRFQFDGLPAGKVSLAAAHPDYLEVTKEIDASAEDSVDLTLGVGGTITGTVVGKDGRTPAAGARVLLQERGDSPMGFGGDSTRTDGSGNFSFENLKPGRYRLSAQGNTGASAPREVVLAENQHLGGVLLEMATGALVRGRVSGLPAGRLGGISVSASAKDYGSSSVTDDQGQFTLRDVPAGVLRLSATTSWMAGRSTSKTVEIPEGASEFPVEIVFEGTSRLSGRVTRGEKPLGGLFVNATPDPPRPMGGRSSAQTDENGYYSLEGLEDGNYQVLLNGPGISYRKAVTVSGDTSADIVLPAVSLAGIVTESGSGEPIEGATVNAEMGREPTAFMMKRALTDSRGFYSLDDVDPGNYQVTARKEGYQLKTQTVSLGSSSAELNFSLLRGAGVAIRATDGQTGLPLRGLSVLAFSGTGAVAFSGSVSLDSSGRGEISSLAPGRYSVYLFSQGYAPRTLPSLDVPSPMVSVAVSPGGTVEFRSDAPVAGRIVDASGILYLPGPWRLDGRVSLSPPVHRWENFAPGSYRLLLTTSSGEKSYPFTVTEGRPTTVEIR